MKPAPWLSTLLAALLLSGPTGAAEVPPAVPGLPAFGPDRPLELPEVVQKRLDNGLTLWLIQRSGPPLVSIYLASRVGQAADPPNLRGLSDVLEATLDQGTPTRSARAIAETLQALGAELQVGVSQDSTWLSMEGLADTSDALMEMLADLARHARYPEREVKLAVANQLESIRAARSQPEYELDQQFHHQLFGDHPYAFVNPDPAAVARITPTDLRRAHRLRFSPDRLLLVMVAPLPTHRMEQLARRHLADWKPATEPPPKIPAAPQQTRHRMVLLHRPGSVQSTLFVGRPLPPAGHPDEIPLKVANAIFGGAFSSRLVHNIREEKGYTYSPHARITEWAQGGRFKISAAVRNAVTGATLNEIFYELDRMATTRPSEEELNRARHYLAGHFVLDNETAHALAGTLVNYWIDGKTPADLERYVPAVKAVTAEQVQRMGARWMTARQQAVAVSGDAERVRHQLEIFGPVEEARAP